MPTTSMSLVKTLEAQILEADSVASEVGSQRETNHKNYAMQPLGNEQKGRSHYISPDVLDSVEAKKAIFTETFFSGRQVVKFVPTGQVTQAEADIKTAYVNACLARNGGFELFRDGWHDAFVAKRMVVYGKWKKKTERISIAIQGATMEQAMMLLQHAVGTDRVVDIDDEHITLDEPQPQQQPPPMQQPGPPMQQQQQPMMQPGMAPPGRQAPIATAVAPPPAPTISGVLTAEVDRSMVGLRLVQPERFYRDPTAAYVHEGVFSTMEEELTRGQLVEEGFDPAQVINLKSDYRFGSASEDAARKAHDSSSAARRQHKRNREQENVTIYRTYTWLDAQSVADVLPAPGDGDAKGKLEQLENGIELYEIFWGHGEVLNWADGTPAVRVVEEMPFFEWSEFKIAHAEHGMCDADVLAHSQRVNSTLKRLVLDNQQMRNTSRYEAVHGAVKNPRDLIDNKIGGVIWSSRIGSVVPLATPELSPLTLAVLQMLQRDNESRTGASELAKGMSTDAIKYQNAADMIERLTNASNRRIMKAARDFAETLLVPLSKFIVREAKRNDHRLHLLNIAGQQTPTQPAAQWSDYEADCKVQPALTSQQGQQSAQSLLMLHQLLLQSPQLAVLYGTEQQFALMDEVFDAMGISDSVRFLMRPTDPQAMQAQQQAQQLQQKQLADQNQIVELEKQERSLRIAALNAHEMREDQKLELDRRKFQLDAADTAADNQRENEKLSWQKITDVAEYRLEQQQDRAVRIGAGVRAAAAGSGGAAGARR